MNWLKQIWLRLKQPDIAGAISIIVAVAGVLWAIYTHFFGSERPPPDAINITVIGDQAVLVLRSTIRDLKQHLPNDDRIEQLEQKVTELLEKNDLDAASKQPYRRSMKSRMSINIRGIMIKLYTLTAKP
jgi:hypothetical protein